MVTVRHTALFRAVTAWLVALALLVPVLLSVVPSPASAAEQALWRDVQNNRCAEQGLPTPDQHKACDICVLCTATAMPQASFEPDPFSAFDVPVQTAKVSFAFEALSRADLAAIIVPDPGRGPPA